jgi:hypothetical protein
MRRAPISPASVRYIKLGARGTWETECIERGIIRIGFGAQDAGRSELCLAGRWAELAASFVAEGRSKGTATRFANELRLFFEDDGATLWITFVGECLHWGMAKPEPPRRHADGDGVWRRVGVVGGTQKTLDLDLTLPSTGERAFVQVKSRTTTAELAGYARALGERVDRGEVELVPGEEVFRRAFEAVQ